MPKVLDCNTKRPACHPDRKHKANGLCKSCYDSYWQTQHRIQRTVKTYGLTEQDYHQMVTNQNGLCFICHKPNKNGKRLVVDHNHTSGKVRALLCSKCNWKVGLIETPRIFRWLIPAENYIKQFD